MTRKVFLIGYRATGKSTFGRRLAERLGVEFCDTDRIVEREIGESIREYFAAHGEGAFREREAAVLRQVCRRDETAVVATGGGIVLDPENVRAMREAGRVIWLRADAAAIRERLRSDAGSANTRPSLTGAGAIEEVDEVLAERTPLYAESAHEVIDTEERDGDAIVDELVRRCSRSPGRDPGFSSDPSDSKDVVDPS